MTDAWPTPEVKAELDARGLAVVTREFLDDTLKALVAANRAAPAPSSLVKAAQDQGIALLIAFGVRESDGQFPLLVTTGFLEKLRGDIGLRAKVMSEIGEALSRLVAGATE